MTTYAGLPSTADLPGALGHVPLATFTFSCACRGLLPVSSASVMRRVLCLKYQPCVSTFCPSDKEPTQCAQAQLGSVCVFRRLSVWFSEGPSVPKCDDLSRVPLHWLLYLFLTSPTLSLLFPGITFSISCYTKFLPEALLGKPKVRLTM